MSTTMFSLKTGIFSVILFLNLRVINTESTCPIKYTPCNDHTICSRVRCASPGNYSEEKPYLILDDCGCCKIWSKCQKEGPCGTCGHCKEPYPICGEKNIVSIDYCGCCNVCHEALGEGQECKTEGPRFSLCSEGLQCLDGKCSKKSYS